MTTSYCLKCRAKREMRTPQQVTLKNGRLATKGTCPNCGSPMYRIGRVDASGDSTRRARGMLKRGSSLTGALLRSRRERAAG
jgi:hypothetical protein